MCLAKYVKLSQMWLQLKPQPKKGDVRITDFHFKDSHNQAWVNRESDCGSVFARFLFTDIYFSSCSPVDGKTKHSLASPQKSPCLVLLLTACPQEFFPSNLLILCCIFHVHKGPKKAAVNHCQNKHVLHKTGISEGVSAPLPLSDPVSASNLSNPLL